ncbi:MAG TPA: hypothetical protein VL727_06590 [Puia sp.]|jgi:hypothetical protein|nr:hypothetical protein [Puia sp.]
MGLYNLLFFVENHGFWRDRQVLAINLKYAQKNEKIFRGSEGRFGSGQAINKKPL